jgi:hypothetical protein
MKRLALLLIAAGQACGAGAPPPDAGSAAIAKAAAYLWAKQGPDGGWKSETYGLLRSGQSLTPFVLAALLEARAPGPADRAREFIRRQVDPEGAVGRADPSLEDYPNYATSLALVALPESPEVERMAACLRRRQFAEELGWTADHPAYGAWGMGGPPRRPPHTGHVDLSMTRHVLEGLAAAGAKAGDPAFAEAEVFLKRCQNPDGGFLFSTVILDANKAGPARSYGTATADGVLSLAALGLAPSDPRLGRALDWLRAHHRVDRVPGFPADSVQDWAGGMIHYYLAASARVFRKFGGPPGWQKEMTAALVARQQADGSFKNGSFLMKEDDPLIATVFALQALVAAR